MTTRTERHREMAESAMRAHQALTEAHVAGREPEPRNDPPPARPLTIYTPQYGAHEMNTVPMAGDEGSLRELQMYWRRIPDFGIKEFEVFPSETGWAQILYWRGTGEDGKQHVAEEVDIVRTDDDFNITRFEIISDSNQWLKVVAYANDKTPEEMRRDSRSYADLMAET